MLVIESAALSDVGQKRKGNEDSFCLDDGIRLYVVSDGMGGHKAGEVASRLVVESLFRAAAPQSSATEDQDPGRSLSLGARRLVAAIHHANQVVFETARDNPSYAGMGATVSAVHFTEERLIIANVGDSPVYLVRDGRIHLVSKLHTYMAEQEALAQEGARTLGEAFRHMLTRAVGTKPAVQPDVREMPFRLGDTVVISSDGLTDMVKAEEILTVVSRVNPQRACRLLVDLANKRGGNDNITVIVLRVRQLPPSPEADSTPHRAPTLLRVDFDTLEASYQGLVRRLSAEAVVIETADPISENQPVTVSFPLPGGGQLTVAGRIASRDSRGITVRFAPPLTEDQKKAIAPLFC
jgi:serine/threonine protein phosphatase PrpC